MAQVPKIFRKKLDKKAVPGIFVGYKDNSDNYKVFDLKSRKLQVTSIVSFDEVEDGDFKFEEAIIEVGESNKLIAANEDTCKKIAEEDNQERFNDEAHSSRQDNSKLKDSKAFELVKPSTNNQREGLHDRTIIKKPERYAAYMAIAEPRSYQNSTNGSNANKWKAAILEEINAHNKKQTWFKTDIPKDRKPISYRWIFKVKHVPGEEDRFKNWLLEVLRNSRE